MDLKDRILKIMTNERMTAAIFADRIGVQRSSISHILSGRNKPSLEFLQKILSKLPQYSVDWLIMGTGEMLKEENNRNVTNSTESLFNQSKEANTSTLNDTISTKKPEVKDTKVLNEQIIDNRDDIKDIKGTKEKSSPEKTIEKIVILYNDNTFITYRPND